MFTLTEHPALEPYTSLLGDGAGPVVDTGCELAGRRVYISRTEAGEIGRLFGFETPEAAAGRTARIADLEQQLAAATARLRDVGDLVEGYRP
jgi:hypothetical protein